MKKQVTPSRLRRALDPLVERVQRLMIPAAIRACAGAGERAAQFTVADEGAMQGLRVLDMKPPLLNYWVGKAVGVSPVADEFGRGTFCLMNSAGVLEPYRPATDWSQAGPILVDEWFEIESILIEWLSPHWSYTKDFLQCPLVWMMRGLVASRFGDEVENYLDVAARQPVNLRVS